MFNPKLNKEYVELKKLKFKVDNLQTKLIQEWNYGNFHLFNKTKSEYATRCELFVNMLIDTK